MKPTKLHQELCDLIIEQATFWKCSNDINSLTHYDENQNVVDAFVIDDKILEKDAESLIECLDNLYHQIKVIGLYGKQNQMANR